ncbi:sensor histidine kinase [Amycolatopsis sp. WGS_07]|uniref:sensor histidine kinase n=1 Tax=Amycolatopsis sp. WGS_07 TaxID=3076764 RepID=UPI0038738962
MRSRLFDPVAGLAKTVWANGPGVRLATSGICALYLWSAVLSEYQQAKRTHGEFGAALIGASYLPFLAVCMIGLAFRIRPTASARAVGTLVLVQFSLVCARALCLPDSWAPSLILTGWLCLIVAREARVAWSAYGLLLTVGIVSFVAPAPISTGDKIYHGINLLVQFIAIGISIRALTTMAVLTIELRKAHSEIGRLSAAQERARMSQELHDRLGHSLVVIMLRSELAGRLAGTDAARSRSEITAVNHLAKDSLDDMRGIVHGGLNTSFDQELRGAVELLEAAGVHCELRVAASPDGITAEALGWIVREGTTNILKHASASECTITLMKEDHDYVFRLENDGAGSGPAPLPRSITDRAARLGGSVKAEQASGKFTLDVRLPALPFDSGNTQESLPRQEAAAW